MLTSPEEKNTTNMTIRVIPVKRFGPERMLSAPRRSPAYPSPDGKYAVYTCSTYSFNTHSKSAEICVLEVATGAVAVISTDIHASEPQWLGSNYDLVWLKAAENSNTSIIVADGMIAGKSYIAGTVPGPVSSMKTYTIKPGMVAVAVAGTANPDGRLHNPKDVPKTNSSARVYDSLFVRHWDTYITQQRNSIFTGLLQKAASRVAGKEGRYTFVGFTNALKGTGLECPIPTFGGTDHFDIGRQGLLIVAKDPEVDPATHTKCNTYFVPREDLMDTSVAEPHLLPVPGFEGAASSPVFSPDGKYLAYLKMKKDGYESDKNCIVIATTPRHGNTDEVNVLLQGDFGWDRSPSSILWSNDGQYLYLQAEDNGAGCLFEFDLLRKSTPPRQLTSNGYIMDVVLASSSCSNLFISSNSLIDNSIYTILDPNTDLPTLHVISSATNAGNAFGLSPAQVHSLRWQGDKDHTIHALMMVPSNFHPSHKYPLAYMIHGGPQGAWNDQWSTRWNPAVFAEQGYVVVCPNPTGSTGYGQSFTDAIQSNWGGSPYIDLEKGFKYIEASLPFVDTSRSVALGASYGGYMMNWMQGHPLGRKFKALVCHDGVFSMTSQSASDEQYFPVHDFGGPIWTHQSTYDKYDPARFTSDWATPMLVIHNELDYRLTIAEGLAAFNVLQMRGVESRFLSFPDENHWVLKHENSLVWHLVVLNWINSFVGLGKVVDGEGRDGSEYVRQTRRMTRPQRSNVTKHES